MAHFFSALPIDWSLFFSLVIVVAADLFIRFFAFGRLESVAMDVAIFTLVYCVIELFRAIREAKQRGFDIASFEDVQMWMWKGGLTALCLAVMFGIHIAADRKLREQVGDILTKEFKRVDSGLREVAELSRPVLERSILVAFIGPEFPFVRWGKRGWRSDVAKFVDALTAARSPEEGPAASSAEEVAAVGAVLTEDDFLLPTPMRLTYLAIFTLLGLACIAILVITT